MRRVESGVDRDPLGPRPAIGEVVDLMAGGQGVFNIVPLAGVLDELEADIVRLQPSAQSRPSGERSSSGVGAPGLWRVSPKARPGTPTRRSHHPAGGPGGPNSIRPSIGACVRRHPRSLRGALGVRARRIRLALGRTRVAGGRLPARLLVARPGSLHRTDHGRSTVGHSQERQGAAHARPIPRSRWPWCINVTSWPC